LARRLLPGACAAWLQTFAPPGRAYRAHECTLLHHSGGPLCHIIAPHTDCWRCALTVGSARVYDEARFTRQSQSGPPRRVNSAATAVQRNLPRRGLMIGAASAPRGLRRLATHLRPAGRGCASHAAESLSAMSRRFTSPQREQGSPAYDLRWRFGLVRCCVIVNKHIAVVLAALVES